MIAVCGDSGTGKTTLASGIAKLLGEDRVTHVCTDDYHSLDRKQRRALGITALHPRANNLDLMADHLRRLRAGEPIEKPVYDHSDGTIKGPVTVTPKAVVFVQGLHPLFTPDLRRLYDLKIYLDPHPVLKRAWKISRDVAKRGYTPEQVVAEIAARQPDAEAYILPQRRHADIIVHFFPPHDPFDLRDNAHLNVRILARAHVPPLDLSTVSRPAEARRDFWQHDDRLDDGTPVSVIEIRGDMPRSRAQELEERIWERIGRGGQLAVEKLGQFHDGLAPAQSHSLGLAQLVLLWRIVDGQRGEMTGVPPAARAEAVSRPDVTEPGLRAAAARS
ncbi:MAG TPA: phosphoribulokinase [Thermodesulfobacteriota bacterium]